MGVRMRTIGASALGATLLSLMLAAPASAYTGYVTTSNGDILRTASGACWHNKAWKETDGLTQCNEGPKDSDGDGVTDWFDHCPHTPKGDAVDSHGCTLDGDHDGVADNHDFCPRTPPHTVVDAHGCKRFTLGSVEFRPGRATLTLGYRTMLRGALHQMADDISITHVTVTGYAAPGERGGMALAKRRADQVRRYMVAQGLDASMIKTAGKVAAGKGRRVEISYEK